MDAETLAVKLAEADSRARSNTKRIDKLEQSNVAITELATSVKVLATEVRQVSGNVVKIDDRLSEIEAEPGKRWKSVVEKTIWAIVGGIVVYFLAQLGIS